jgi:hypothetical protein
LGIDVGFSNEIYPRGPVWRNLQLAGGKRGVLGQAALESYWEIHRGFNCSDFLGF